MISFRRESTGIASGALDGSGRRQSISRTRPACPVTERHYRLGGDMNDFDCVRAMRRGQLRLVCEQRSLEAARSRRLTERLFSVHLIAIDADPQQALLGGVA